MANLAETQATLGKSAELKALLTTLDKGKFDAWLTAYAPSSTEAQRKVVTDLYLGLNDKSTDKPTRNFYQAFYTFMSQQSVDATQKRRFAIASDLIQVDGATRTIKYEAYDKNGGDDAKFAREATITAAEMGLPTREVDIAKIKERMEAEWNKNAQANKDKGKQMFEALYNAVTGGWKKVTKTVTELADGKKETSRKEEEIAANAHAAASFIAAGYGQAGGAAASADGKSDGKTEDGKGSIWGPVLAGVVGLIAAFFGSSFLGGIVGDGIMGMLFKGAMLIGLPLILATQFGDDANKFLGLPTSGGAGKGTDGKTAAPARGQAQGQGAGAAQVPAAEHYAKQEFEALVKGATAQGIKSQEVVFVPLADNKFQPTITDNAAVRGARVTFDEIKNKMSGCTNGALTVSSVGTPDKVELQCSLPKRSEVAPAVLASR